MKILQVGPYPEWDQERLDAHFTINRYFEAADKAAFLAEHGGNIRGIATRGELGANRATIEALPKLEVISVYGVGFDAVDLSAAREESAVEKPGPGRSKSALRPAASAARSCTTTITAASAPCASRSR